VEKRSSIRSCLACRVKAEKTALLRFVVVSGRITPDWRGILPGRAVYACLVPSCISRFYALKRLPDRFFDGTPVYLVPREEIGRWIRKQAEDSLSHFLNLARKSGVLIAGQHAIGSRMAPAAVLLATDLAQRTERNVAATISPEVRVLRWGTKERIGAILGTRPLGVVAFGASPLTERIIHYISIVNLFCQEF